MSYGSFLDKCNKCTLTRGSDYEKQWHIKDNKIILSVSLHFPSFTANWKVVRSCTDELDINMFMVDHVCMSEGGGRGKMCFCEDHECNHASSTIHFGNRNHFNLMKVYPLYIIYNYYNNVYNIALFLFPSFSSRVLFRLQIKIKGT